MSRWVLTHTLMGRWVLPHTLAFGQLLPHTLMSGRVLTHTLTSCRSNGPHTHVWLCQCSLSNVSFVFRKPLLWYFLLLSTFYFRDLSIPKASSTIHHSFYFIFPFTTILWMCVFLEIPDLSDSFTLILSKLFSLHSNHNNVKKKKSTLPYDSLSPVYIWLFKVCNGFCLFPAHSRRAICTSCGSPNTHIPS